jgi:hypothetical protein
MIIVEKLISIGGTEQGGGIKPSSNRLCTKTSI